MEDWARRKSNATRQTPPPTPTRRRSRVGHRPEAIAAWEPIHAASSAATRKSACRCSPKIAGRPRCNGHRETWVAPHRANDVSAGDEARGPSASSTSTAPQLIALGPPRWARAAYLSGPAPLEPPPPARLFVGAVEKPSRTADRSIPRRAGAHEGPGPGARASSQLQIGYEEPRCSSASWRRPTDVGPDRWRAALIPSITILRSGPAPLRFVDEKGPPAYGVPAGGHRPRRRRPGPDQPGRRCFPARPSKLAAHALFAARRGPGLSPHLVPQGPRGHRPALHTARPRAAQSKGRSRSPRMHTTPVVTPLASVVPSATTSRSASSAKRINPTGAARRFARGSCAGGRTSRP